MPTFAFRMECAEDAVTQLMAFDHPGEPRDWTPTREQIEQRTTQLHPLVTLEAGEADMALARVLAVLDA